MTPRRREVLLGASAAIGTLGSLPAPAIAQGIKEFKLVTAYPRDLPGSGATPERLAQSITAMSDGRLKVTVYPADTLVRALEVFDAVSAGAADMYFTDEKYFQDKAPALNFFSAVPYGLATDEFRAWLLFGGGQALWDEVDAQFGIKPVMLQSTGVQMGGWFSKEVNTPDDFKGLRYRMPELGAEVLRRMGATVVLIPAREIASALNVGARSKCHPSANYR
jgi:TRAP-type mannitol/chloroaromatic compound transport system substrate-binding protein